MSLPKRRLVWTAALAIGASGCRAPAPSGASTKGSGSIKDQLRSWDGKEISQLAEGEQARFKAFVLQKLLSPKDQTFPILGIDAFFMNGDRAYVWHCAGQPKGAFLVFLVGAPFAMPSFQTSRLFAVTEEGNLLSASDFRAAPGWYPVATAYKRVGWLSTPVLVQEIKLGNGGGRGAKVYFGLDGFRPAIIRREGGRGQLVRGEYYGANSVAGPLYLPAYRPPSVRELEKVLTGRNEVKLLEALTWLTGDHEDVSGIPPPVDPKQEADALAYARCVRAPSIVRAVNALVKSPKPYVRQLAASISGSKELRKHFHQ